ncbi:MAG: hypothetical protein EA370_10795, partial [Wenzhouxiangella sp.]
MLSFFRVRPLAILGVALAVLSTAVLAIPEPTAAQSWPAGIESRNLDPGSDYFMVPRGQVAALPDSARLIHDYPDSVLVAVPPGDMPSRLRAIASELEDTGQLSYRTWQGSIEGKDPTRLERQLEGYYLLALAGPLDWQWRQDLRAHGLTLVDHVNPYGLLVHGHSDQIVAISAKLRTSRGFPVITAALPLPEQSRVEPEIYRLLRGERALDEMGIRTHEGRPVFMIEPHNNVNPDRFEQSLMLRAAPGPEFVSGGLARGELAVQLAADAEDALQLLLENPDIAFVHAVYPRVPFVNLAAKDFILNAEPVWNEPSLGYTGAGIIAGVNDSGIDLTHPDFPAGSVVATKGVMSAGSNSHGTHVTGTMAGRGAISSPTNTASCGDLSTPLATPRGIAWGALITHDNIFDGGSGTETQMMQWHAQQGALLTNNSWGYGNTYSYLTNTAVIDARVRNADPSSSVDEQMTIVFAAGNDGPSSNRIGTPGNAKNAITVGATQNDRCGSYVPSNCAGPSLNSMACFSGRGPAQQRIKPDLVAPGADVLATGSRQNGNPWDQSWTGSDLQLMPGTSMASPMVAGAAAVFMEAHQDRHGYLPSPALVKAALINTATDLGFGYPSMDQGWGRVNLRKSIEGPVENGIVFFDQDEVDHLTTGQTWTTSITVIPDSEPFRVSLVWTDPPGAGGCNPCHVNDLDLRVTSPDGTIFRGNQFSGAWSVANPPGRDGINNVENVFIQSPLPGEWQIEVTSVNTAQNPSGLSGQDFALVASGPLGVSGISIDPPVASVCGSDGSTSFGITLSEQFQASTALSLSGLPGGTAGSFSPNPVSFPDTFSELTVSGLASVASGTYLMEVSATEVGDPANTTSGPITLMVSASEPAAPVLSMPSNGALGQPLRPTLSWTASADTSEYLLEISTDPGFASLVYSVTTTATSHELPNSLAPVTTYYWKVTASNFCGNGASSATRSFTTIAQQCELLTNGSTGAIQDAHPSQGPRTTVFNLTSGVVGELDKLEVIDLRGTHTWMSDLSFDLVSPGGTSVRVMDRSCGNTDNFWLSLSDDAAGSAGGWPCPPTDQGSYRPSNPLAAFQGDEAAGVWQLRITDHERGDSGTLQGWGLNLCVEVASSDAPAIEVNPTSLSSELPIDGSEDQLVTISNAAGTAPLVWSIDQAYPASVDSPPTPFVAPLGVARGQSMTPTATRATSHVAPASWSPALFSDWVEGFEAIGTLPDSGWALINNSSPLGGTGWFQGNTEVFDAHQGSNNSYIGANFANTTGGTGTISNWLISPEIALQEGTELSFFTRTIEGSAWPDRLQLRLSTAGSSTNVGTTATSVGDFSTVLVEVNPGLAVGGYPDSWTEYVVTLSDLPPGVTTGRFAFRYFVTNAGPDGANSNYIGIDTVTVVQPEPTGCSSPQDIPWLSVLPDSGTTPPGQSDDLIVSFDATGLTEDSYEAVFCVFSNDPVNPLIEVPVFLEVEAGGGEIEADVFLTNLGQIYTGGPL